MSSAQPVPPELSRLLAETVGRAQGPVRFRPRSWESALADVGADVLSVLHDDLIVAPSGTVAGDRTVDRTTLEHVLQRTDLADEAALMRSFLLVQVWGAGTSGSRTLRHTATAFAHRDQLAAALRSSATSLRRASGTGALAEAYRGWSCPGVGPSFFTKWFAYAGCRDGRPWQPLILDDRVYRALNQTLDVRLVDLAASRSRAARYQAYVEAVHAWAAELGSTAGRLEWLLFLDNGRGGAARAG